jgi:hypothetical protein
VPRELKHLLALACYLAAAVAQAQEGWLAERLQAALERRGPGVQALGVIDNLLAHEAAPPRAAPPVVRELLARPAAAADAAALFARFVPEVLFPFATQASGEESFEKSLSTYIAQLAEAQRLLRAATGEVSAGGILAQLRDGFLTSTSLSMQADAAEIEQANTLFIQATARFAAALRSVRIPAPARFDSPIGAIVIGSRGDDVHTPGAALIVEPGGNDLYTRAPAADAVSLIFDLGGNDRYGGADIALRGFSALIDYDGDDRYAMDGAGLGAAIAGASLLVDFSGNDLYEARIFGLGAAAFGLGALIDEAGDDRYRVHAWGQGFALAGGVGVLWDHAGNDHYAAAGLADPHQRGGALSGVQGSSFGYRTPLGGGTGILRDGAGNDTYEAGMFAQGTAYYYGLAILWDEGGDDVYKAVRYAQGNGVHEAVGVLRDDAGNDRYELSVGVGQGMGLDLALGVLVDAAGDDHYKAPVLAQGSATANGIGILAERGGSDRFQLDVRAAAEWSRGLPSLGVLLHPTDRETTSAPVHERPEELRCPAAAALQKSLAERFEETMARLNLEDFDQTLLYAGALRCAMREADLAYEAGKLLAAQPPPQIAIAIARGLYERPAADTQMLVMQRALARHPSCAVRAAAVTLWPDERAARAALRSTCWRLQAAAVEALRKLGVESETTALPSFLIRGQGRN